MDGIDLDKGLVVFSLGKFDRMRDYTKELKAEIEKEKEELEEVKENVLQAALQLEIFLSYLSPLDEFKKAVAQFNEQSEVSRIIIRKDGKIKIQIFEKKDGKSEEKKDSKKEN